MPRATVIEKEREWAKQRPELFSLDVDLPDYPILWEPAGGETHGQMRKRLMVWACEVDDRMGEILNGLFYLHPQSVPVIVLADQIGYTVNEMFNKCLERLKALGLVETVDNQLGNGRLRAPDFLFGLHEPRRGG